MVAVVVGEHHALHHIVGDAIFAQRLKHKLGVDTGVDEHTAVVVAEIRAVAAAAAAKTHEAQFAATHHRSLVGTRHLSRLLCLLFGQNHLDIGHRILGFLHLGLHLVVLEKQRCLPTVILVCTPLSCHFS